MKMCEALSQHYEVELIVPRRLNPIKRNSFEFYDVEQRFKIVRLPCLDFITLGFGKVGFWLEAGTFFLAAKIYLLFQKKDIRYTRDFIAGFFLRDLIVEAHYLPEKISSVFRMFIKETKAWIVLTRFLAQELVAEGVLEKNILIAPDAVDIKKFDIPVTQQECRERLQLPKDKKIVLYTGHLYEWKGVDTLIVASALLDDSYIVYLVGGTVEDVARYKKKVEGNSRIVIVGHRSYLEIPLWLKAADVLVLPNMGEKAISRLYTSPMKLFEYMASKRPIISSDLPSLREILNENNAFFVAPGDARGLAQEIKKNVGSNEARQKTEKAFLDVQQYTWEKRAKNIATYIENINPAIAAESREK